MGVVWVWLGVALTAHTGREISVVTAHEFQLSVALQWGNRSLILSRIPQHPNLEVDSDVDCEVDENGDLGWGEGGESSETTRVNCCSFNNILIVI